jgi:multidrug efflux pump subunit AcrA (membrane-fusion protein)
MTANITIVTERHEDALLIPSRAITADRETGTLYVERLVNGDTQRVEVEIGIQDASNAEVTRGLEEGDQLVISGTSMRERLRGSME